jgi:hypothetical protein
MSTKTKKSDANKPAAKSAKKVPAWIGSGKGKAFVREGVDLTKPTFKVGRYFA